MIPDPPPPLGTTSSVGNLFTPLSVNPGRDILLTRASHPVFLVHWGETRMGGPGHIIPCISIDLNAYHITHTQNRVHAQVDSQSSMFLYPWAKRGTSKASRRKRRG